MKNIERWLNKGLIDESLAAVLQEEIDDTNKQKFKRATQITLYTIGVILLGISAISFIAVNDWILDILEKLAFIQPYILLGITLACLFGGYYLAYEKKNLPGFGNALIFLSTILIGGVYALMTQIYNVDSDAVFVLWSWFISIFPLAFLFKSRAINWLCIILFIIAFCSTYAYWDYDTGLIWTLFMPFTIGSILYSFGCTNIINEKFTDFAVSYKLSALIPIFITLLILIFSVEGSYLSLRINYILPPVLIIIFNCINFALNKSKNDFLKIETAFIVALNIFMLYLLLSTNISAAAATITAHLFLIYLLWTGLNCGYKYENVSLINMMNFMLIVYIFSTYCSFEWMFIDKTIFFFTGGVVLVGLGFSLEKYKRKVINNSQKEEK